MASSLCPARHYQISKPPLYIYSQIRLKGHITSGRTVSLVLKLGQCSYLGQIPNGCLRQTPGRGRGRVKVWGARAITGGNEGAGNTSGKTWCYFESQNVKPALPNPTGRRIGLVAGAGLVLAAAFALFKLAGKVFLFSGWNTHSAGSDKLRRQSSAQPNDFVEELPISRSLDTLGYKINDKGLISSLESTKIAEEVDLSANGITDTGLKAHVDIPPANDFLKTPNLSGSPDGDKVAKVDALDLNLPRRSLLVLFTCDACGSRTQRIVNRQAYEHGTIFVQCAGCEAYHKLVDNLGLIIEYDFRDDRDSHYEQS